MNGKESGVEGKRRPWWQWIYLSGLDAPLIAFVWLFLFAQTWRVIYHPWEAYVALTCAVWCMRLITRQLGKAVDQREGTGLEISTGPSEGVAKKGAVVLGLVAIVLTILNFPVSVYNYLLVGGFLCLSYLALSLFWSADKDKASYTKHVLAGGAFAFGTASIAHAYLPNLGFLQMIISREFICFSLLCVLALAGLDMWERASKLGAQENSAEDEIALALPLTLLGGVALVFAVQNHSEITRPFFYAILTGAASLQILNRTRMRFSMLAVRALTGLALLLPGLVFKLYAMSR